MIRIEGTDRARQLSTAERIRLIQAEGE